MTSKMNATWNSAGSEMDLISFNAVYLIVRYWFVYCFSVSRRGSFLETFSAFGALF